VFDKIRAAIKERLVKAKESIYDETKHTGNLRHIVIRQGFNTGEILLISVTRTENIEQELYQDLSKQFNNIVGFVQNINPERTNRILGSKNNTLWGRDYYYERILDKKFKVSAGAFFQVNTFQAENIVKKLREYIGSADAVLDLYCGGGMLSIMISDLAKKIYGIEVSKKAIQDAQENIKLNNISNIEYLAAPVEVMIKKYRNIDTVILDPPRKGCALSVLEDIVKIRPVKIIYISCNPTTFARDLAILSNLNYQLAEFELLDMFPQTFHIESIAKIVPK
jgi:23S rRNA (uracil1939-C5)-methyltransferase